MSSPAKQGDGRASAVNAAPRLLAIAVLAAVLGLVVSLSFGYADHDPTPHGVKIAIAAPATTRAQLSQGLSHAQPGSFQSSPASSSAAALRAVRAQRVAGALVAPRVGAWTIVTAGAAGVLQKQAITAALSASAHALHRQTRLQDVAPLPSGDRGGISSFVFSLGLLIPSIIGGLGLFLVGMNFRVWWRVAAATVFALLVACAGVLIMDTVLGALRGAGGALIAIGFLGALGFVLFGAALQAVIGLPGTGLAALVFIFVGNAVSGGTIPNAFLPDGFRQVGPWLPNAAIVQATRHVVYFSGHNLGHPLLVLALWPALALSLLTAVDLLQLSERRRAPHLELEIYRTPGIVHARRRLAARHHSQADSGERTNVASPSDV